ncbi:hypothetical protein Dda_2517 [Drechslerella dactyloides]|uniref:Uncharacterized protein n=1 Tax=Drechslerella dactyloides TaxID=74499 RepID=A0AAD6IZN1_DREDA|nr:hypothetical protein Dda_2517 [Drechslerella dactyloides]
MGQTISASLGLGSPPDEDHPPDRIIVRDISGRGYFDPFYVDFDDPESLVRELKRYNIAGTANTSAYDHTAQDASVIIRKRGQQRGRLYLIGVDEMPTSIVRENEHVSISAVYDTKLPSTTNVIGTRHLEDQVYPHHSLNYWDYQNGSQPKEDPPEVEDLPAELEYYRNPWLRYGWVRPNFSPPPAEDDDTSSDNQPEQTAHSAEFNHPQDELDTYRTT